MGKRVPPGEAEHGHVADGVDAQDLQRVKLSVTEAAESAARVHKTRHDVVVGDPVAFAVDDDARAAAMLADIVNSDDRGGDAIDHGDDALLFFQDEVKRGLGAD